MSASSPLVAVETQAVMESRRVGEGLRRGETGWGQLDPITACPYFTASKNTDSVSAPPEKVDMFKTFGKLENFPPPLHQHVFSSSLIRADMERGPD